MAKLTRDEAYEALMAGHRITHESFTDEEFLELDKYGTIRCEQGYNFDEGWEMRSGICKDSGCNWEEGWSRYAY